MIPDNRRHAAARGAVLAGLALASLLAACEAKLPTSGEIDAMDVKSAETGVRRVVLADETGLLEDAHYLVDGKEVSAGEAHALRPEQIAAIQVTKENRNGMESAEVRIVTRGSPEAARLDEVKEGIRKVRVTETRDGKGDVAFRAEGTPDAVDDAASVKIKTSLDSGSGPKPLLLVDGVRTDESALAGLRDRIASVEVLKGEAATRLYGAEAAGGVIRITTKK